MPGKLDSLSDMGNYDIYKMRANNRLGQVYRKKDLYETALSHQFLAMELAQSLKRDISVGLMLGEIANTYSDAGDAGNAVKYYREAIAFLWRT